MPQKSNKKNLQRLIVIASGLALVGSSSVLLIEALFSDRQQSSSSQQNTSMAAIEQLKEQAKGYEAVLKREPNNSAALQNLAKIRLNLQDYQGAIDPLEKLVKLYPQDTQLPQLLTAVKQRAQEQKQQGSSAPSNNLPSK
jgi:cytochrome c-type biogenesis protein CcmH/NrfG